MLKDDLAGVDTVIDIHNEPIADAWNRVKAAAERAEKAEERERRLRRVYYAAQAMRRARQLLNDHEAPCLPPKEGKPMPDGWAEEDKRLVAVWRKAENRFYSALMDAEIALFPWSQQGTEPASSPECCGYRSESPETHPHVPGCEEAEAEGGKA